MQHRTQSFDGTKLNYDVRRSEDRGALTLVFLHGAGGDLTSWQQERAFFHHHGYATIAMDLRGHGLSERPENRDAYSIDDFARDVKAVLDAERVNRFVLVGHCLGGMVAMNFHARYPRLAKAYVLIDTTYKAPRALRMIHKHPFLLHVCNTLLEHEHLRKKHFSHVRFSEFKGSNDVNVRRMLSDITHTTLKSWVYTYEHIADFDAISTLKRMKTPVLIIEGENDSVLPPRMAREIHRLVRKSELDIIPDANHILIVNNPSPVEHTILSYLERMRRFIRIPGRHLTRLSRTS